MRVEGVNEGEGEGEREVEGEPLKENGGEEGAE